MQVIHPRQPRMEPKKHKPRKIVLGLLFLVLVIVGGATTVLLQKEGNTQDVKTETQKQHSIVNQNIASNPKKGTLKQFTGEEFKALYNTFTYPNTMRINQASPITGNEAADAKIRQIAINRGYSIRSAPITNTFENVGENYVLQQRAAQPWRDLVAAAKKDNISLGLTAAYRSAEEQNTIFLGRLAQQSIAVAAIPSGAHDAQISQVLRTTAVPGFSRHHTGYTVDIACEDMPNTSFMYSSCFEWLSASNYEKAKTYGWIPSYPEGAGQQGPDPESWEYVWVGRDAVTE